ncbi:hypothetical protein [Maricaulis sp.]|uniref:hypothetical protein n=1 Tax=Maricaulis sp. TaxID=1486257 RepID=UPI0025DC56B0|nr:hypothetical protein [Maricaulis sp.]MDF1768264.1 hypothetical protein [Maricaulis sp.]
MIVRFLFAISGGLQREADMHARVWLTGLSALGLAGCVTAAEREPDVAATEPVVELVTMTPILQGVQLGDGLNLEVRAARGPGGVFLTVHLPLGEALSSGTVQTIVFEPRFPLQRLYRVELDGEPPFELVVERDFGLVQQWTVFRAGVLTRDGPSFWHSSSVPPELIDLEDLDAELLLDFDPAAFD